MSSRFKKFTLRRKRDRVLWHLNEARTFQKIQQAIMSDSEMEKHRLRHATAHLRQEWRKTAHVIDLHQNAPDSDNGLALLSTLQSGDIPKSRQISRMLKSTIAPSSTQY